MSITEQKTKINKESWIVVTNPKAGKRAFKRQAKFIKQHLNVAGIEYDFKVTEHKGHATEIALKYVQKGYSQFLVLGGDGTISEIVNGIMKANLSDTSHIKIGLVPRGTGNDWGRFWKIKNNDKEAFEVFLTGKTQPIDIGEIDYQVESEEKKHYFINSIGFGLDGLVIKRVERYKKKIASFRAIYLIGLIHSLFLNKHIRSKIILDDTQIVDIDLYTMNIANGCYTGGGIKQNPNALPYDGVFDMMMVGKFTFLDILKVFANIFNGKIARNRVIQTFSTKHIQLKATTKMSVEADGILLPDMKSCSIKINPHAIQMIVP